jgi:hypothetical protein
LIVNLLDDRKDRPLAADKLEKIAKNSFFTAAGSRLAREVLRKEATTPS